jgi:hypothetical protein
MLKSNPTPRERTFLVRERDGNKLFSAEGGEGRLAEMEHSRMPWHGAC